MIAKRNDPGHVRNWWIHAFGLSALGLGVLTSAQPSLADEPAFASAWVVEQTTRVRLIAGGAADPAAATSGQFLAGVDIQLEVGWKTYWRNPGSSGVPPRFDFAGSENVAEATPLYPAPQRFVARDGDTIGYKKAIVLPIAVTPKDPSKPVVLKLALEYGVCKEVCIPAQPNLTLDVPPAAARKPAAAALTSAVATVPRQGGSLRPGDPELKSVAINLGGDKPSILIEARFPGGAKGYDAFLEAPDGLWIPLPKPPAELQGEVGRFAVDLTDGADIPDLKGRTIRLTLVSTQGQSETSFKLE